MKMPDFDIKDRIENNEAQTPDGAEEHNTLLVKIQAVLTALEDFVVAASWRDAKQIVEAHQAELLTDVADNILVALLARYEDIDIARVLVQHRRILQRCRLEGIDAAFAELIAAEEMCPPDVSPLLWRRMVQCNTFPALLNLLAEHPTLIPYARQRAAQLSDQESIKLLNALLALLQAGTWKTMREIVVANPALLSLAADIWLMQYAGFLYVPGRSPRR